MPKAKSAFVHGKTYYLKTKNALIIDVKGENEMMKKTYIEPEIEIVCFGVNDVVTASGNGEWDSKEMIGGDLDW